MFCKFIRGLRIKATEIIKTLEHILYQKQVREQELLSLEMRRAQGVKSMCTPTLGEGEKKMESGSFQFPVTGQEDKLKHRKFCLNKRSTGKGF